MAGGRRGSASRPIPPTVSWSLQYSCRPPKLIVVQTSGSGTRTRTLLMDYGGQPGWRIRRRGCSSRREGNGNHACILEGSLRIDPKRWWGRRATVKEYLFRGLIEQY